MTIVLENAPVVGKVYESSERFQNGEWTAGLVAYASAAVDVGKWIEDPIKQATSWVIGLILDRLQPLQDALDELVGDPGVTEGIAAQLSSASDGMTSSAESIEIEIERTREAWIGAGVEEFSVELNDALSSLRSIAFSYTAMGVGFSLASSIVAVVRKFVLDLIKDLLSRLISYLIKALAIPGLSWPIIGAEVTKAVRDTLISVTDFTSKLDQAMTEGKGQIDLIIAALEDIKKYLSPVVTATDQWK